MKRKILLESLSVGRCFTLPRDPGPAQDDPPATEVRAVTPILAPAEAWRVTEAHGAEWRAVNAVGEEQGFAAAQEVVEIPRQGYDTLAARG